VAYVPELGGPLLKPLAALLAGTRMEQSAGVLDGAQYASYGLQIFGRHEPAEERIAFERSLKRGLPPGVSL